MNRRGFLQMLSAIPATIMLPVPNFVLASPKIVIPSAPIKLGLLREIVQYRIGWDDFCFRIDAFNEKLQEQFHVDFALRTNNEKMLQEYEQAREAATTVLINTLKHRKWNVVDMRPLPYPSWYSAPTWMN